jgi:hypothetical protein
MDMFINPLIKTDWNDSYHVMLHRHEAPYTAMLVKKNMQKCCPSLRRGSPTVSQQLVFSTNYGHESSAAAVLACVLVRMLMCHRAVRKDTHTLACNECHVLMRHRAVRKDTHTLACNEFRLLMCLRTVREGPMDFRVKRILGLKDLRVKAS